MRRKNSSEEKDRGPDANSKNGEAYPMSDFPRRNYSTFCSLVAIYAQKKLILLHGFLLPPFPHLHRVISLLSFALILGSVLSPVYYTVRAGRCFNQRRVLRSWPLAEAGQPGLASTYLRRSAVSVHSPDFLTGAFEIAHLARQQFGILALLRLSPVRVLSLSHRDGPTLFFCKTLAQPLLSALLFNPLFLGHSTKLLPVRGQELSHS